MTVNSAFEIREERRYGWARLLVSGELDVSNALTFRRRLRALKAANLHVCVDLSQLEFIDCPRVERRHSRGAAGKLASRDRARDV
jgi:hypothetical protein